MKISILAPDLSSNLLVRTYPIAKVLERHYEVEIIGPVFGEGIFEPYRNEFHYKPYFFNKNKRKLSKVIEGAKGVQQILKFIEGDVVYAFKPRSFSFGIGLLAKYLKKRPLILDIEDWEAESYYNSSILRKLYFLSKFYKPNNNPLYNMLLEPLTKLAGEVTVVSNFLQNRYGGIKLPHGANCNFFDPSKYNRGKLRNKWRLTNKFVILFTGMPHIHKGIDDLVKAIEILSDDAIRLMLVIPRMDFLRKIKNANNKYIIPVGPQPHSKMPEFLELTDLVVLPQKNTKFAQAQVPGKVFEAMAMTKPIIATNVGDLPEILNDCGWIVEPENPEKLAEKIQYVLSHPEEAKKMGQNARKKCIEKYSWDAMEKILIKIFKKYEKI